MKKYIAKNHVTPIGIITLIVSSLLVGVVVGLLAFLISNFLYLHVVFPIVISTAAAFIVFDKYKRFIKVRHSIVTALFGFITGLIIAVTFYTCPYLIERNNFIKEAQQTYQLDVKTASQGFDWVLTQEVGSSGLWGYMKFRAREGNQYTNYLMFNTVVIQLFDFTLKSVWAWLYWVIETLLFALPFTWIGFRIGKGDFNRSANDWYKIYSDQTGTIPLEYKEKLLRLLDENNIEEIAKLIGPEDVLEHPTIEIDECHCKNKPGDVLLTFKETYVVEIPNIKRIFLGSWELTQEEYRAFIAPIKQKTG